MQTYFIELSYLLASVLFILGLKGLTHPETAKRGMHLAEFGMLMAIIGTLVHHEIVSYTWILSGLALGSVIGLAMGLWVPMTAMPQRTALSHAFGAFAAALVGISEFYRHGGQVDKITMAALGFEVMLGALTTTGSLLAFAKALGEFGATITFVSSIPGETETIALAIYGLTQVPGGDAATLRLASVSIVISLAALVASEVMARRLSQRVAGFA